MCRRDCQRGRGFAATIRNPSSFVKARFPRFSQLEENRRFTPGLLRYPQFVIPTWYLVVGVPPTWPKYHTRQYVLDTLGGLQGVEWIAIFSVLQCRISAEYDLRNTLLEYQRHTLEELCIASNKRPRAFMGSLCEFTALKAVKLNSRLLWTRYRTFKLVPSFPPSIEFIEISGELEGYTEKASFIYAFSILRESSVPNLKTVYALVAEWPDHFLPPEGHFQSIYKNARFIMDPIKRQVNEKIG
ncbi:hypothetical protein MMC29_007187 [Sticta canariensis]|nr:hypothetical protein [Sticta canariensis]